MPDNDSLVVDYDRFLGDFDVEGIVLAADRASFHRPIPRSGPNVVSVPHGEVTSYAPLGGIDANLRLHASLGPEKTP